MTDINDPLSEPLDAKRRAGKPRGTGNAARARCRGGAARPSPSCCSSPIAISPATPTPSCKDFGFGRAHHRVLHFVNRHSGLRVADLLDILKITKQSLARVLKQLIDKGYIVQQAGSADRRERLLYPDRRAAARWPSGSPRRSSCALPRR